MFAFEIIDVIAKAMKMRNTLEKRTEAPKRPAKLKQRQDQAI